jgi:hypothetical protein
MSHHSESEEDLDFDVAVDRMKDMFPQFTRDQISKQLVDSDYNFNECFDKLTAVNNNQESKNSQQLTPKESPKVDSSSLGYSRS